MFDFLEIMIEIKFISPQKSRENKKNFVQPLPTRRPLNRHKLPSFGQPVNETFSIQGFLVFCHKNLASPAIECHFHAYGILACQTKKIITKPLRKILVGDVNPFEKYESNWIISPRSGENEKNWNHHLENNIK